MLADAENYEASMLESGIDKYMPTTKVKQAMNTLEKKYSTDHSQNMNEHEVDKLTMMHSKERFKAMKDLDRQNESASPRMIAKR